MDPKDELTDKLIKAVASGDSSTNVEEGDHLQPSNSLCSKGAMGMVRLPAGVLVSNEIAPWLVCAR